MPSKKKPPTNAVADPSPSLDGLGPKVEFLDRELQEELAANPFQPGRLRSAPENGLGDRLHEAREARRLTQGELAQLTRSLDADEKGISRAVVSLYEAGKNRPSPREIRLLCEALKVTPNFLIYGDERPFNEVADYQRLGSTARSDPEGYAWMAHVFATLHHNHFDALMALALDLQRGWNREFDQGLQDKANQQFLEMAKALQARLQARDKLK